MLLALYSLFRRKVLRREGKLYSQPPVERRSVTVSLHPVYSLAYGVNEVVSIDLGVVSPKVSIEKQVSEDNTLDVSVTKKQQ